MEYNHEQYSDCADKWLRARDVIDGEDTVKTAGVRYLPQLPEQSANEYEAYKHRAKYLNATGRTLDGLQGMVFRKEPVIKIPEENKPLNVEMAKLVEDADLKSCTLSDYARNAVREVLSVSRAGTFIDWNEIEARSYLSFYKAEDVWDWHADRIGGKMMLVMVALHECIERMAPDDGAKLDPGEIRAMKRDKIDNLLVCRLDVSLPVPQFTIDRYELREVNKKKEWVLISTTIPTRRKVPLPFIPFVFHSPDGSSPGCCKLPLEDLISVNLHHYRLSADYNHGLHFTALPTAWVAGFDAKMELRIGSSRAWVSDNVQAKAGFLEYTGQGLGAIKDAIDDDKKDMATLGARLLEEQKREAETAETLKLRQAGESSVLSNIAKSVGASITAAMKICYWWMSNVPTPEEVENDQASIELNTDYVEARMAAADINALVASWISGAVSHETLLYNFRRGELMPKNRTDEEEMNLIKETGLPPGGRAGNNGDGGGK
jgi:hypothetical protein